MRGAAKRLPEVKRTVGSTAKPKDIYFICLQKAQFTVGIVNAGHLGKMSHCFVVHSTFYTCRSSCLSGTIAFSLSSCSLV